MMLLSTEAGEMINAYLLLYIAQWERAIQSEGCTKYYCMTVLLLYYCTYLCTALYYFTKALPNASQCLALIRRSSGAESFVRGVLEAG
jgi:hypothetical protein